MNCPRCRGNSPAGAAFCPNCGNDLRMFQARTGQTQPPQQPQQPQQPRVPTGQPVTKQYANTKQPTVKEQLKQAKAVAVPTGYYQSQPGVAPVSQGNNLIKRIIFGSVALLLLVLGLFAYNTLKKTSISGGPVLAGEGKQGGAVLQSKGRTDVFLQERGKLGNVLQDTGARGKEMPADVHRWLEHLERIEKLRGKLAQKGLSKMMIIAQTASFGTDLDSLKMLAQGDPDSPEPKLSQDEIAEASVEVKAEWAELKKDFESFPPPQECVKIADPYRHALDETGAMISDVMDALAMSKDDTQRALQSLYAMQNQSKSIDEYGNTTDSRVHDICDKYDKRKWFKISSDFGSSNVLGAFATRAP